MKTKSISPYSALALLLLFKQRKYNLTLEQFEECFDALCEVLEAANDEKYRLEGDTTDVSPPPSELSPDDSEA